VFEKGGVNSSAVEGTLSDVLAKLLNTVPQQFFAAGISLVLHPKSPMIPTVHANLRYLELEDDNNWFGGGADLTPYYLFDEDAVHFHQTWKNTCDRHDPTLYPAFKTACDRYFFLPHRGEARGIGGIFFDYHRGEFDKKFPLIRDLGHTFLESYIPIVERRIEERWGDRERDWQLIRRGRYVEFNLIYDRGTLFGLETQGRSESILMSLPPLVRWAYDVRPEPGSREHDLLDILRSPRSWVKA
jgi:coproporphyrinogen III oxidase